MSIWYEEPTDSEIKEYYGLDPHEWTGSLSDKVTAVVDKNVPEKETYVNALLRDGAYLFAQKFQIQPERGDDDELRDAITHVAQMGVPINDEALLAIKAADDKCVIPFGAESLTHGYDQIHDHDYAELYYRTALKEQYREPSEGYIERIYGLSPQEWTGSLSDKVMAIVNKDASEKEKHVNALLRDGAYLFAKRMEMQTPDAMADAVRTGGDELRAAISDASWAGVLINDEAMEAIKHVEKEYITEFGGDSLTRSYEQMRKLNDARAHYREVAKEMRTPAPASPAPATPSFDRFAPPQGARVTTVSPPVRIVGSVRSAQPVSPVPPIPQPPKMPGSQVRTGGPVRVGNVAKDWLASMGRDEKGQPLASAPAPSTPRVPVQRSGSIQASLPGSGVTVGRSTPRVPPTARRMGAPEPQVQSPSVDDGFEL
jgi:hypothetical protein